MFRKEHFPGSSHVQERGGWVIRQCFLYHMEFILSALPSLAKYSKAKWTRERDTSFILLLLAIM
jgi:hypothetical protein